MSASDPPILKPKPIRMWTTSPLPSEPTSPSSPVESGDSPSSSSLNLSSITRSTFDAPRPRSFLNLTASTLAGIYAPDDDSSLFGVTPLHTPLGATTPRFPGFSPSFSESYTDADRAQDRMAPVIGALEQPQFRPIPKAITSQNSSPGYARVLRGLTRAVLLFGLGAAYGSLVTHLHDTRNLAPVKLDGLHRSSVWYTLFWGVAGILFGTAMPVVDAIWEGEGPAEKKERVVREAQSRRGSIGLKGREQRSPGSQATGESPLTEAVGLGAEWNPVVRSIGAFIGIGFAIRRLPWQSTLQASLTLSLVNPCLWYTIDRTFPGFALASVVGVLGTSVLLGTNVVPMPDIASTGSGTGSSLASDALPLGIEQGTLAVWVWIASVLFCSCVCFGNIGRRLALGI